MYIENDVCTAMLALHYNVNKHLCCIIIAEYYIMVWCTHPYVCRCINLHYSVKSSSNQLYAYQDKDDTSWAIMNLIHSCKVGGNIPILILSNSKYNIPSKSLTNNNHYAPYISSLTSFVIELQVKIFNEYSIDTSNPHV